MQSSPASNSVRYDVTRLSDDDVHWLNEGSHFRLYDKLGAHYMKAGDGVGGTYFAVFAPHAESVSVFGDFNDWNKSSHSLQKRSASGVWEGFVPKVAAGARYKFVVERAGHKGKIDKADPYGFRHEEPPSNTSIVCPLDYTWGDDAWIKARPRHSERARPISIYEVHLGSWMHAHDSDRALGYAEIAEPLAAYVKDLGFTHVELLPVMEHPFYGSWGYQCTGYFAPTSRYGRPQDLMHLIDCLHQNGIGVILDWAPAHFPRDEHGLGYFDGTHLYEHADPRRGFHPEWKSFIFDYGRREVQSFLFSSAFFWADKYHADGFRVDAVTSMLYLNYARKDGEWLPNKRGGHQNLEAEEFLKRFNNELNGKFPEVMTFAEESTDWPGVTRSADQNGLGFDYKWDMGWMNDTLSYFRQDPIHRKAHHNKLTFRMMYAHSENYVLPLSHDEVVHGKASLLAKMPGNDHDKFSNLRLLLGSQYLQPGKKLLFMGNELGQWNEWRHDGFLDWTLREYSAHEGVHTWVRDLNRCYKAESALHGRDHDPEGFAWVDCQDTDNSVISFLRRGRGPEPVVLCVFNHTPVQRDNYRIGVPQAGYWREILNSDATCYGGGGVGNLGGLWSDDIAVHGLPHALNMTLPPLSCLALRWQSDPVIG